MIESTLTEISVKAAIIAAGCFFLTGLLTGVWKYWQIARSESATAHPYVDIAHRSSLLYSFAAILIAVFSMISQLPEDIEFWAVLIQLVFFSLAIGSYILHGMLADTDNQLKKPHKLSSHTLPSVMISGFMWSLVVAEVGGFVVLFYGVLERLL